MTYNTGGPIQATDYNTFSTLASGMNQVYADFYPGATTLPDAGYGYGQTPALTSTASGQNITALQWASLFDTMKKSGTHQGTTVVPPLPIVNPVSGGTIVAENTPTALAASIALLSTNRFNLAVGQSTLTTGTPYTQTVATIPWTTSLTFNYQVDLGTWNNARYFFNSGGKLQLNGSYAPAGSPTPEENQWILMLGNMSPLVFAYNSTTPNIGTGGTSVGFYGLTTSYQTIYIKTYGTGTYYSANYIQVSAKLNAAAGTNGLIDFRIALVDEDIAPTPKTGAATYRVDTLTATGASVVYPGTVSIAPIGINNGYVAV